MKKSFVKILTAVLLAVCLSSVAVFTAACSGENVNIDDVIASINGGTSASLSESASAGGSADASDNKGGEDEPASPAPVDRSEYSALNAASKLLAYPVYDLINDGLSGKVDIFEGYMLGDLFNALIPDEMDGVPGSNLSVFRYTYYSDGYWVNNLSEKRVHKILNAFLCFKLDGSEPLALTEEDVETYGNETILTIMGYGSNPMIANFIESSPVVKAIVSAKIKDLAGLFNDSDEVKAQALLAICGKLTVGELAATFGANDVPEKYAALTVAEVFEKVEEKIADIEAVGEEEYFEALAQAQFEKFIAEYGEYEVLPDVTVIDLIEAIGDPEGETAQRVYAAAKGYASAEISENVDEEAVKAEFDAFMEKYGEVVIYGEKTVADFVAYLTEHTEEEIVAAVEREIAALQDEEYALEQFAPLCELLVAYADGIVKEYVDENLTFADLYEDAFTAYTDFSSEEAKELVGALITLINGTVFENSEFTLEEFAAMIYEEVKDVQIYGEKTVADIVESLKEYNDVESIVTALKEEYDKLATDEDYFMEVLNPYYLRLFAVMAEHADDVVIDAFGFDYTVGDLSLDIMLSLVNKEPTFVYFAQFAENLKTVTVAQVLEFAMSAQSVAPVIE